LINLAQIIALASGKVGYYQEGEEVEIFQRKYVLSLAQLKDIGFT